MPARAPGLSKVRHEGTAIALWCACEIGAAEGSDLHRNALAGLDASAVRTVIPNADQAAAEWYRRTGAYPVNHLLCVKTASVEAAPWLPAELMRLFVAAKALATEPSAEARFAGIVGPDVLPYGLEANRIGIELCLRYTAEQGLVPRVYEVAEIFA